MEYRSLVEFIGPDAFFEDEPILILFNNTVPDALQDVCVIHGFESPIPRDLLKPGSKMVFGKQEYTIEKIGDVANETLYDLSHISLYFTPLREEELMPGAASLSPFQVPKVKVGDVIRFIQ